MPNTAPGAQRLAGGAQEDTTPASSRRPASRAWRWAGVALFLLVILVLFDAYLHLSKTYQENSDEANILLMANDLLHGNVYLSGWYVSDVPFISTELPQIALLVWMFGLHLNTAHIAAAVTYTLVVAVAMLLAKGKAHGWAAVARMGLVLGIMLAPQPGVGIFVAIFSVGHIGTALPVMLTWLVLDRLGRHWYVPLIVAVMLAWALMADPLVLVVAVYPMLVVCLARVVTGLVTSARNGGGLRAMRRGLLDRWLELSLAAAAGVSYLIVVWARLLLRNAGGYVQQPVPYQLDPSAWFWHTRVVVHGLLQTFGAYFVPGQAINYLKPGVYLNGPGLSGLDQAIALTHLVGVVLAVWGACAIARRFFFRDADFVSQLLLAGIVANLAAYIPSTLANSTALNVREVAPVLPFAAVLAGRMLGDRLLTGPLATVRLPRATPGRQGRPRPRGTDPRTLRVRLIALPLIALFGWYSFGLFRQADTPAAPEPLAAVAKFLEDNHLSYGLGGYWDASVLTVETGGAVTVRAVTPACLQPYTWESKAEWYDPAQHKATFVLVSQVKGYFTVFLASGSALGLLNQWYYPPNSSPPRLYTGGSWVQRKLDVQSNGQPLLRHGHEVYGLFREHAYTVYPYPGNLLTDFPRLLATLNVPPQYSCGKP